MTIVLARSRPFFGAQITCIPAVYAVSLLDGGRHGHGAKPL